MQAAWLLRLLSGSQMALQKKGAALREVVGKPPWELCHQSPSPTKCLHPAARQVGRSVATCARSLNVQRACVCGISGCGRGCIVGLPRRPCGAGIDIPQLARQCRVLPGAFGRRVSFLAEGVKRDSEESHLLKALSSGGGCTLKRKVRRPC